MKKRIFRPQSRTINFPGIGGILFQSSKRATVINISVNPSMGVRVAIPHGVSFKKAEAFVNLKIGWVKKQIDKIGRLEKDHRVLKRNLSESHKAKAKQKLIKRLKQLSEKYGLPYHRVFIRNQKTRWGSCSKKNNINLNVNLVQLPDELSDYVMLHELAHTVIENHGDTFWEKLNGLVRNAKEMDNKLNKYRLL